MKCAKCGTLISEGSTSCTGCNTPISELIANNLLIKENKENPQAGVINISNQAPVVDIAPVPPVDVILENPTANPMEPKVEEVPSVVEIAPVVEKTVVENVPVVEERPVVESIPVVENTQGVSELKSENVQVTSQEELGKESTLISDNNTIINSVVTEVAPTTTSQPTQTPGETQMTDAPEVKEKGKGKVFIAIVVGVVLLIVGVVLGFIFLTNKPSSMFKTSISLVRSKLNSVANEKPAKASLTFQTNG